MTVYTYDSPQGETDPQRATRPIRETPAMGENAEVTQPIPPIDMRPQAAADQEKTPVFKPSELSPQAQGTGNTQPLRQVMGKAVISVSNGQKLGSVQDILIDPQQMRVAALVLSRGGVFNRDVIAIPVSDVQAWGVHAIMVDRPDVAARRDQLPQNSGWVSATDQLYGRPLLSSDGTKIGEVEDVEIDGNGNLSAYQLGKSDDRSSSKAGQKIPARYTRSIGRDVIIVDQT